MTFWGFLVVCLLIGAFWARENPYFGPGLFIAAVALVWLA